jgi:hypothetical protein
MRINDIIVETDLEELRNKTLTSYVTKRLSRNPNLMKGHAAGKSKKQRAGVELAMDKMIPGSALRKPKVIPQEENVEVIPEADATDTVTMDVPLLIRIMEYAREDAKTDMDLHDVAEKLIELSKSHDYLCMDNYNEIVSIKEDDMEESNAFTDARMNAIKAGKKSFNVGGKTYPVTGDTTDELEAIEESCPHCGGLMLPESRIDEKKDACYYKVKSRYKVWPSAYASGALVKCRKAGAKNWGNKSK